MLWEPLNTFWAESYEACKASSQKRAKYLMESRRKFQVGVIIRVTSLVVGFHSKFMARTRVAHDYEHELHILKMNSSYACLVAAKLRKKRRRISRKRVPYTFVRCAVMFLFYSQYDGLPPIHSLAFKFRMTLGHWYHYPSVTFFIFEFFFFHFPSQQKILFQWRMRQTDDIARLNASQTSRKVREKQIERRWCSAKRFLHSEKGAFSKE